MRIPLLFLAIFAVPLPVFAQTESRPPNIVVIFADDLGYGDLGPYGGKIPTPHLDRMAREGVRFTDFYTAQAVCSASRTALLTGCYPNRLGILGALGPQSRHGIADREQTIAEVLKTRGYATAIYGKWHLGHHPRFLPTRHGFDDYFGLPYSNDMWPRHPTATFPPLPLMEREQIVGQNPDQTQLTTWYTERAVKFIGQNKDRPFFLYVPHSMPHVPLFVSDRFKGKSGQGLYGDVIAEIDWSVGEILRALQANGLDEKTLVVFTSDNGPWLSYGNHSGVSGGLREGKGTAWEGGVRVPCLVRWPGRIPAGSVCREPAMTIDLLPTFAGLAGAVSPLNRIDGLDINTLLLGKPGSRSPHEALYFYWDRHLQAVRSGRWKLHFPHTYRTLAGKPGGRDGKPAAYGEAKIGLALYDLEADPGETSDVAEKNPTVVERLQKLADLARAELGDTATKQQGRGVRAPDTVPQARGYTLPVVDLSTQTERQTIVDREKGQYLGHPTTVLLEDGRTLLTVYPKGHGRGAIILKRSNDGGKTWSKRLPTPSSWATSKETPTIHRVVDPRDGKKRLLLFSGLYPIRLSVSEDDGTTWSELKPIGDFGGIVAMSSVERLRDGTYLALFHDDGRFFREGGKAQKPPVFHVYKTFSKDGGLTWSAPEVVVTHPQAHLCEPGLIRSRDGKQLALLLRENSRKFNSFVTFSTDEGQTWSAPRELPASLTGDRHVGCYAPDGRLFVTFRDTTLESKTKGDWVGWVGTFQDLVQGRDGQYRVRLMKNHKGSDCAYPGLELLPDGTFVTTTYGHWTPGEEPYVVSVRFKLAELDAAAGRKPASGGR